MIYTRNGNVFDSS